MKESLLMILNYGLTWVLLLLSSYWVELLLD